MLATVYSESQPAAWGGVGVDPSSPTPPLLWASYPLMCEEQVQIPGGKWSQPPAGQMKSQALRLCPVCAYSQKKEIQRGAAALDPGGQACMSCDCHISERCGARQALSILEPHLASIFSLCACCPALSS